MNLGRALAATAVVAVFGAAFIGGAFALDRSSSDTGQTIRALVTAYDGEDARRICRLNGQSADRRGRCVRDTATLLRQARRSPERWQDARVLQVRTKRSGAFWRASVRISFRSTGRRHARTDTWWLDRANGRWRVLKAGAFAPSTLGLTPEPTSADRPVTPGEEDRERPLAPQAPCAVVRATEVPGGDVEQVASSGPRTVSVPQLDLIGVGYGQTGAGRPCLLFSTAASWRTTSGVEFSMQEAGADESISILEGTARIDGAGKILGAGSTEALTFAAQEGDLVAVLPGRPTNGEITLDVRSFSTQPAEPLLGNRPPVGDLASGVRIAP